MNRHSATQIRLKPEASESTKALLFDLAYRKDLELHGEHNGYKDIIWLREGAFTNSLIERIEELEIIAKPPRVVRLATEEEVMELSKEPVKEAEVISKDGKVVETKTEMSVKDRYHFEDVDGNIWIESDEITPGCKVMTSVERKVVEEDPHVIPDAGTPGFPGSSL